MGFFHHDSDDANERRLAQFEIALYLQISKLLDRQDKIMTQAQSVVDAATTLVGSFSDVLGQFEAEVTALQSSNPGVDTAALSAAITAGQTALTTAQTQVASWTPATPTPVVDPTPTPDPAAPVIDDPNAPPATS